MKFQYINLCSHEIIVRANGDNAIYFSPNDGENPCRLSYKHNVVMTDDNGISTSIATCTGEINLPPMRENILYIVSEQVLSYEGSKRPDLRAPGPVKTGFINGVKSKYCEYLMMYSGK